MAKRITMGTAQIEPRFILWQRIRFPLALGIVLVLLTVSGLLLWSYLVSRSVRNELTRATDLAALDTFASHQEAAEILDRLAAAHPDDERVTARVAWHRVLWALRFGATAERLAAARGAVTSLDRIEESCLRTAARAGLLAVDGDLARAGEAVGRDPSCVEGLFVQAVVELRRGDSDRAMALLDRARRGDPPFVPALGELVRLLRQRGRIDEARAALALVTKAAPAHEDAAVEGVLLALDALEGDPGDHAKALAPLRARISSVEIGADAPRTAAQKDVARGRIALHAGELEEAEAALAAAAAALTKNEPVATWLAEARLRAGRARDALDALEGYADAPTTSRALLEARIEALRRLGRTADARPTLDALAKAPGVDLSAARAALLVADVAGEEAVVALERAVEQGDPSAALDLAEELVRLGRMEQATAALRRIASGSGEAACAAGLAEWLEGRTARARAAFSKAAVAGVACAPRLAGRLLLDAGVAAEHAPHLRAALATRPDPRDQVLLGRMVFRVDGAAAARRELEAVDAAEPQAAAVLRDLAEAYREMGALEDAARVAKAGVERTDGHPDVVAVAARIEREAQRLDAAESLVDAGLAAHGKSPDLLLERAAILLERGRFADAESAAEAAMEPGPRFADAACARANAQLRRGDREGAQVDLRRNMAPARRHSGPASEAAVWACLVDLQLQRGPSALTRAKTALFYLREIPVESATIEYLDARVARRDGRPADAAARLRKAVELDPAHRDAWRELAKVGSLDEVERRRFEALFPGDDPRGR